MKKLLLAALLLWGIGNLHAQKKTVEKTLTVPASQKVNLNLKFANDIKITAWDKKEAYIKVTYEINGGKGNEAMKITFTPSADQLSILTDLDHEYLKTQASTENDCPDGYSQTSGTYIKGKAARFTCTRIDYEIFLPRQANVTLETINGDIELRGFTGPVKAKSISGFVDMDWPTQKGASVALKTITGEVFTDLALQFPAGKKEMSMIGHQLNGSLNKGGAAIQLESISNNIYLRKKK
ncbi:hypothetical protein GU926_10895 [Nibribacter ruber]|uniref:DUF4097 family beta strand repeat protein n=1 Tax=Nibribacter ruber TaxID=2698458 RepID=A0A6P1NZZ5_9BACT|nr:hypothetical protein [Nibribacter ruber]QHL87909.1 hypothetical protein GU926_10895 [Nibribacter ruber]